jgi:hypothetical protein
MKKILFAMMACVAMFAFTACEKSESQIFDLTYDETTGDQAEIMAYQLEYREIFIQELSKVAKPVTEAGTTFMINDTKNAAVKSAKAAFENAGVKAQTKAGDNSIMKGFKVILKHSVGNSTPEECASFTFK